MNSAIDRLKHRLIQGKKFTALANGTIYELDVFTTTPSTALKAVILPTSEQKPMDVSPRDCLYAEIRQQQ